MQFDRHMLKRLLAMNDAQLSSLIEKIATEAGINPAQLGLNPSNIQSIRETLERADAEDLQRFQGIYDAYRTGRRKS